MTKARKRTNKPKPPKEGSDEWYMEQQSKPAFVLATLKELAARAAQGNKESARSLEAWVAKFPDLARSIYAADTLRSTAEATWVKLFAGGDPLRERGIREEIDRMTAELVGESPSLLERVLVSNFVVAYMANQRAVWWLTQPTQSWTEVAARDRRAESTARRLLLAVKTLSVVRQQASRGRAPKMKLKLFDGTG